MVVAAAAADVTDRVPVPESETRRHVLEKRIARMAFRTIRVLQYINLLDNLVTVTCYVAINSLRVWFLCGFRYYEYSTLYILRVNSVFCWRCCFLAYQGELPRYLILIIAKFFFG